MTQFNLHNLEVFNIDKCLKYMAFYNDCFSLLTMFLTSYQQKGSNYEKGFINFFILYFP